MIYEVALRLLRLYDWINRLDRLCNAVKCELDVLQRILEESQKERQSKHSQEMLQRKKDFLHAKRLSNILKLIRMLINT